MADSRQRTTLGTRFRFLVRAAGITGAAAAVAGVAMAAADATPPPATWSAAKTYATDLTNTVLDGGGTAYARAAVWMALVGLGAVALAAAVELVSGLTRLTGRRTAANTAATVGTAAAVALLVFANAYSFTHHRRFDLTRDRQFTLPADLAGKLRTLRPDVPTTIVVLQKHSIFGTLSDDRDSFTKAAEEKVTEKVKDLVDLFRELGPRFRVEVLDTEAFEYRERLAEVTRDAPELRAAIDAAPENSIFFHANKRVQRLGFNEFLQLDKTASEAANGGRGNLVLLPQGIDNFARRVLAVQERRPKVAVCVVGEWLAPADTDGQERASLAGMKRALADSGFDVVEIILKKNWMRARQLSDLEPAAFTMEESTLERLEGELATAAALVRAGGREVAILEAVRKDFDAAADKPVRERAELYQEISLAAQTRAWGELVAAIREWSRARGPGITADNIDGLRAAIDAGLKTQAARAAEVVEEAKKSRAKADDKVKAAYRDERSFEDRRERDVKAKFAQLLADVDLLIVHRPTLLNAINSEGYWPPIHALSDSQVEVVKDFMKAGKPVLACLGSPSWSNGPDVRAADGFERLVAERGVELGRDTVLFDGEASGFADLQSGGLIGGGRSDVPPLVVVEKPADAPDVRPNPVAAAVRQTARSVDQKLDLRLRAPRPVYLARGWQDRLSFASEFLFTSPESWNEEKPLPARDQDGDVSAVPRYEPTLQSDPKWNTRQAERRGAFPVGVAVEGKIPAAWVKPEYEAGQFAAGLLTRLDGVLAAGLTVAAAQLDRPSGRLVVFGSGHVFSGPTLAAPQEKLLLHSVNWLTGRDDRLPRADQPAWSFPRVEMPPRDVRLWRLGTAVGLPLLAVFAGLMVVMIRRLR